MALTQHQTQHMILEALHTLSDLLSDKPLNGPEEQATTVLWGGDLTDPDTGQDAHAVVYLMLTEDAGKATTIADSLGRPPFQST